MEKKHQQYFASKFRVETRGKQRRIIGEIPYNKQSRSLGGFIETLRAGCFADSLKRNDPPIVAFWNHNRDQILGSTANRTLKLKDTPRALTFEILPPETSFSADAISLISSGTVSGCSFSFSVRQEAWDKDLREVISADLHEISPCTQPAYKDTTVAVRSRIKPITDNHGGYNMTERLRELVEQKNKALLVIRNRSTDQATADRAWADFERISDEIQAEEAAEAEARRQAMSNSATFDPNRSLANQDQDITQDETRAVTIALRPGEVRYFAPCKDANEQRFTPEALGILCDPGYEAAFRSYVNRGILGISEPDRRMLNDTKDSRALQVDIDTSGGYYVPPGWSGRLIQAKDDLTFIRRYCTILILNNAASLPVPELGENPEDFEWTGEIKTAAGDTGMDFRGRLFTPHPLSKPILVSKKMLRLVSNIESYVTGRLAYKFAITEEKHYLTGHGSNQPLGIFTPSATAGISTGRDVTTGAVAAVKADDLKEAVATLKQQYRRNARWLGSREFYKRISKLKDGQGNYLLQLGIAAGQPDRLLGYEMLESEYAPANTSALWVAGAYVACFCDLSMFWIVEELSFSIQHLVELHAGSGQDGFYARAELDGCAIDELAFVRLKLQ